MFICYKETDDNGQRTRDSQWAQDVYYGLTDAGYKVFFSRITLEDKLGQQYEPYIFAALNSAWVMVVIGSKPEYFNAVWVKNEWSRYLALMANDRTRLLIPCYRDMDPYDLPEELSALQSQDMSKIGFMQDLLRGVKKVLDAGKKPEAAKPATEAVSAANSAAPGVASLLERAYLFMEDGDFDSAAEYLDRVLDIDPKFAPAYAAKACVAFKFRREADLANATFLYEDNTDWQKALRFANAAYKATYEGYDKQVKQRVERQIRDFAYDCAVELAVNPHADGAKLDRQLEAYRNLCSHTEQLHPDGKRRQNAMENERLLEKAVRENEPGDVPSANYDLAAERFETIGDAEAAKRAEQCRTLAEQARQKAIYLQAKGINRRWRPSELKQAARLYRSIPDYADAAAQAQKCAEDAESILAGWYDAAVKAMQAAGESSLKWVGVKNELQESELDGYRDVAQLRARAEARYRECLENEKRIAESQAAAAAAKEKRERIIVVVAAVVIIAVILLLTKVIIPASHYKKAESLRAAGELDAAAAEFAELGEYKDAAEQAFATYYAAGESKREAGDWDGAVTAFSNAGDYKDALKQIYAIRYQRTEASLATGWIHTVGLKRDGTVVAVGNNDYGQCDVSGWTDIGGGLTLE